VGAGVLGSAIGMDKDVMKRLLRDAKIAVCNFLVFRKNDPIYYDLIVKKLGTPLFVKPANTGSSVGINKAKNQQEFEQAVKEAFQYDTKIIIEEFIKGREIECAVLGNDNPIASLPGEIVPHHEFYSYEAKYVDENGATLHAPAILSQEIIAEVQALAIKAAKILECSGMARVDFFVGDDGKVYLNEINTIPGFTSISMYSKMLEVTGISYPEVVEKLIQLSLEKFKQKQQLKTFYL
jgi:D-alanine-D-alanine ligase